MTFGTEWGWGSAESAAREMFDRYLDAGGNFIDTADGYTGGTSETLVGKFIRDRGNRDRVVLATKFTLVPSRATPTPAATGGRTSTAPWRGRCGGSRPTSSTCTGCTPGTG